ncbi:MAG: 3-methyladenine DNA glycosylase [Verrucomicrobiota bacterium]
MTSNALSLISESEWRARASHHHETLLPIVEKFRNRRARDEIHPVHDFLFTYYPFPPGKLLQWHPAVHETLAISSNLPPTFSQKHYLLERHTLRLDPSTLRQKDLSRFRFTLHLLEQTASRTPNFACHGLHEWAMVYKSNNPRHRERAPLRLSPASIAQFLESRPLACSHFDATRFFTPEASERNLLKPELMSRDQFEQPGCIHANMDLYKWSFKTMPWLGSDLLRKSFFLALELRELDMRASPYDLSHYGYQPIPIETDSGRRAYESAQKNLAKKSTALRVQLINSLQSFLPDVTKA